MDLDDFERDLEALTKDGNVIIDPEPNSGKKKTVKLLKQQLGDENIRQKAHQ